MKKLLKSKLFIIIASVVAVLAVASTVFALNFNNWFGTDEEIAFKKGDIYWNIDGAEYGFMDNGKTSRGRDKEDGFYHVLFLNQNRQVTRRVSDNAVINKIDSMEAMGLKFDEKGIVIDAIPIEEMGNGYACKAYYVKAIDGTKVTVNSAVNLEGIDKVINLSATAKIFDLSGVTGELGIPVPEVQVDDCIYAITDKNDKIIDVYITERYKEYDFYYNLDRQWDSKFAQTARTADPDGLYTYVFAHNGEHVTLRAIGLNVANQIDSQAGKVLCFNFDENGNIIEAKAAAKAIGGGVFGSYYDVTNIEDNEITVERKIASSNKGQVQTASKSRSYKCYDVSEMAGFKGEPSEPQVGYRTHGIKDSKGNIVVLYIVTRPVDSEFYYNLDRKYDSTKKVTTRVPDAQGYYVFKMAVRGQIKYYKTKDKEIATKIDSYGAKCVGLKLKGDIIEAVYAPTAVKMGSSVASYYDIESIKDGVYFARKNDEKASDYGKTKEFKLAKNCEIYVVGGSYLKYKGEPTNQLFVGDQVQGYSNADGEVVVMYVVNRRKMVKVPAKTAYCSHCGKNVQWYQWYGSSITESGHFLLMDNSYESSQCNISPAGYGIGKAPEPNKAIDVVVDLNGKNIVSSGRVFAVNDYCKLSVYDSVGTSVTKSTYRETGNQGAGIWVKSNATVNFHGGTVDNSAVTTLAKGSVVALESGGTFNMYGGRLIGGTSTLKTTISASGNPSTKIGSAVSVPDKTVFNMYGGEVVGGTSYNPDNVAFGGAFYVIGTVNMHGGTITGGKVTSGKATASEFGGNIYLGSSGGVSGVLNMSGGTIKDGIAKSGGNIYVSGGAVVNMSGGTVSGGKARIGGNIYVIYGDKSFGTLNMSGGTVTGGYAQFGYNSTGAKDGGHSGNIYAGGKVNISGGVVENGTATSIGGGNICANNAASRLNISGGTVRNGVFSTDSKKADIFVSNNIKTENLIVSGKPNVNIYLAKNKKLTVGKLSGGANITLNMENPGEFANGTESDAKSFNNSDYKAISYEGKLMLNNHFHCVQCSSEDCTEHKNVPFTPITQAFVKGNSGKLPTAAGHYYLAEDITVTGQATLDANAGVDICLNGHTLTRSSAGRILSTNNGGNTLSFTDCKGTGEMKTAAATYTDHSNLILVSNNATVNIYGGTFTGYEANFGTLFTLASGCKLNLYNGTLNGGKALKTSAKTGGAICIYEGATFNMYGATVQNGISEGGSAGNIMVVGTFNMYGGTVKNGQAKVGGNIYVSYDAVNNKAQFNMKGGTVEGGVATYTTDSEGKKDGGHSGNIYGGGIVKISGGEIIGGVATNVGGGNISANNAKSELIISGGVIKDGVYTGDPKRADVMVSNNIPSEKIVISGDSQFNIYLASGKFMTLNGLKEGANIVVTMAAPGKLAENATVDDLQYITWTNVGVNAVYKDGVLSLANHKHCLECAETCEKGHEEIEFSALTQEDIDTNSGLFPTSGGNYYLAEDITVSGQATLAANAKVNICFNGHTITRKSAGRILSTNNGGNTVSFTDCGESGGMFACEKTYADHSNLMLISKNATVNIYGGEFKGYESKYGTLFTVADTTTLNVYGGTLIGGTATTPSSAASGAINVASGGTFNMSGGTLKDGATPTGGAGNVMVAGTFNFSGGTIENGTAKSGGNIYVYKSGIFNMTGGTVSGGIAQKQSDGGHGGNIYVMGTAHITGGEIVGGKATSNGGGNISANNAATVLELKDVTVKDGIYSSDSKKADVYIWNAALANNISVSGKTKANIFLDITGMTVGTLNDGADIGIAMKTPGQFASGLTSDLSKYFRSTNSSYKVVYSSGKLSLAAK